MIDDLTAEPAYQDAERVIREAEDYSADLIIGIGGGSVMDAAKLCSVLKGADYTIRDLLKDPSQANKQVKTVMIPTTCGTDPRQPATPSWQFRKRNPNRESSMTA